MLDQASRQRDFPWLEGKAYLNTAAEGIPPRTVVDALGRYADDKKLGMDGRTRHEVEWASARERTGQAFGLAAEEIGLCSCSSEAFNLAASALALREGDEVVITDLDFPAGVTPWLRPGSPAEVRLWNNRDGALRVEDLAPLLNARTRLVTLSLVSFYNGFMVRLPELIEAVRRHSDALIALDVTQALGRIPVDLSGVDLIVSSTHKWILGSHGGGLVGVPASRASTWTAAAGGWFNVRNAFDADRFERAEIKLGAASFMTGMPNYAAIYAVNAALTYVQGVGVEAIDAHARPLVRRCLDELRRLPVQVITPDEDDALAGIVAFRHPDVERLAAGLRNDDVHIMCQAGRLRVALHGYNTGDDVERLIAGLAAQLR